MPLPHYFWTEPKSYINSRLFKVHFKATCDSFYQQRTVILNFSLILNLFRHTTSFFFFLASERLHLILTPIQKAYFFCSAQTKRCRQRSSYCHPPFYSLNLGGKRASQFCAQTSKAPRASRAVPSRAALKPPPSEADPAAAPLGCNAL